MTRGKFIIFEGINGAGKTTIINNLINYYINNNIKYEYIKFPNRNSDSGRIIDKFLKNQHEFKSMEEQIKIFAINRKETEKLIKQYLNENKIVLCDRYLYSNIAYTLADMSMNIQNNISSNYIPIDNIIAFDKGLLKPDFIFLINGNFLHLRQNEIKERYYNNDIKNGIIFNNYLFSLVYTDSSFYVLNNKEKKINDIVQYIYNIINSLIIDYEFKYF